MSPARPGANKPFRFSCSATAVNHPTDWALLARKLEDLGFSTLSIADHLGDQLAPVPALMAAAGSTTTLKVAPLVFANDYRHPVVLAKEAATIDALSGGRLEFGIGAGWMESDYEQAGIPMEPIGRRIDRLKESIAVIKALWSDGPIDFHGEHYRIAELDGLPKPVQKPRPPITIGGGSRKVLQLAAREADIVGLNPSMREGMNSSIGATATPEHTEKKLAWIRDAAGERFDQLELHTRVHLAIVTDDRDFYYESMSEGFGISPNAARQSPHALCGTDDQIVEDLLERRDRWGISYIGVSSDAADAMAPVVAKLAGT